MVQAGVELETLVFDPDVLTTQPLLCASLSLYFLSTLSPSLFSIDFCCACGFMVLQHT